MRVSTLAALMILTTLVLSGCGQDKRAVVENRGSMFYGRTEIMTGPTYQAAEVDAVSAHDLSVASSASTTHAPAASSASGWQWPVEGQVIETFGKQADGGDNPGITIAAAEGAPIRAAQAGEVAFVGSDMADYGNMVILRHANGDLTSYAHAQTISVKKGKQVAAGEVIGIVGTSGAVDVPQLHFAMREGTRTIDPLTKLPHQVAGR